MNNAELTVSQLGGPEMDRTARDGREDEYGTGSQSAAARSIVTDSVTEPATIGASRWITGGGGDFFSILDFLKKSPPPPVIHLDAPIVAGVAGIFFQFWIF